MTTEAKAWECPYQEKGSGEYAQRCGGSMGHLCHRCRNDEANKRQKELLHTVRTYLRGYMNEMNERADARAQLLAYHCAGPLINPKEEKIAQRLRRIQQAIREGGGGDE